MKKPQNYYFEIINPAKAIEIYKTGTTELYKMYKDSTEALIESENDLNNAIDLGIEIGIERLIP
jgi:hypothetical protein